MFLFTRVRRSTKPAPEHSRRLLNGRDYRRISARTIYGISGRPGWRRMERQSLALQELGGWQSETMVRRYAHFSVEHLRRYVDRPTTEEGGQNVYRLKLRVVKGG